ncbi:MAG: glutamate 5-kinase [Chromatiales bacterium]|nr:glutamate 5-kinase [Chromatiales bacterium]
MSAVRPWVVKIGSALLTNDGRGLDHGALRDWVDQVARLWKSGLPVVLVSSGSIAEGMSRMRMRRRPVAVHELQALAAIGQMGLVQAYESCFARHGLHTAQVLLTHEDFSNRSRYLNARSTLRSLLAYGVVPVINENDTVATDEIRLGDNDTLAGLVANLVEAALVVILTDQAGLFDADPRTNPSARLVVEGRAGDPSLDAMAGDGGVLGRGGMRTKLRAAALAARSGTATRIASGREADVLGRLAAGESIGTLLVPGQAPIAARKRWLAGQVKVRGRLEVDAGAARVLRSSGRSLLAVGVRAVAGEFSRGDIVACHGPDGAEVARGLVNYSAAEVRRIMGQPSERIVELLGYVDEPELIHRDNLVVIDAEAPTTPVPECAR